MVQILQNEGITYFVVKVSADQIIIPLAWSLQGPQLQFTPFSKTNPMQSISGRIIMHVLNNPYFL